MTAFEKTLRSFSTDGVYTTYDSSLTTALTAVTGNFLYTSDLACLQTASEDSSQLTDFFLLIYTRIKATAKNNTALILKVRKKHTICLVTLGKQKFAGEEAT